MKRWRHRRLFFAGWMLALAGFAVAEQVDPRFPADRPAVPPEEWTRWPRARVRQLEAERDQLLKKISVLPQHDPQFQSDHLGFHSLFEDPDPDGSLPPHQIDIKLSRPAWIGSIALAPAFNPKESEGVAYAFPKRFKIEVLNAETGEFETVVDWMEENFPDPGPYPVFFAEINRLVKRVRITVPQVVRESGVSYFALGEIYLFHQPPDGQIGGNMVAWKSSFMEIAVSDSFTMPPLWNIQYLYDGVAGFGFPLSDETVASEDLMITFEDESPISDKVQVTLDLGRQVQIGRIDFWPAAAPYLLALPSFGFPQEISVELSSDPDFKTVKVLGTKNVGRRMYCGNLFSVIGEAYAAQYIRITMGGFSEYKGKRILGLGEISVSQNEKVWSIDCKVTAQGIPMEDLDQLPRLVDGCSRQRRILPQGDWIKGLALRRPLDRRLAVVERELELAQAAWRRIKQRSGIWAGSIVFIGLISGLVVQQRMRKRGMKKLKWRIARDLHDDVGSNLGSISLVAERLENDVPDAGVKEDLSELSLLAREASASLRDVVWVIDQGVIRLPELIQKLVERAERVLHGVELSVEIPQDCPDTVVPLTFKRHLIMFFKEAVHNCARHANASQVQIAVSIEEKQLRVRVSDNGCGFDPSEFSDGWGLNSMKERAQELGGEMELKTRRGEGTTVVLKIPLVALSREPNRAYKSSN